MNTTDNRLACAFALTRHIKGLKLYMFISVLFHFIFKILPILVGVISSYIVSVALLKQTERLTTLFIAACVLVLAIAVFAYLDILVSHDMAYRILTKLRDKAYDKIDELAPAVMEGEQSGNLISIILEDIELLEWFYAHTIEQIAVGVIIPIIALVYMGTVCWIFPAIMLPFILLLLAVPKITSKKSNRQGADVRKASGVLNAEIVDGVQGIKEIISFRWQAQFFKRFFKTTEQYNTASLIYSKRSADEKRLIDLIIEIAGLTVKIAAAILVISNSLSAVWLMPIFILSSVVFSPIHEALAMSTNYGMIFGAAKRLMKLLEMKPSVYDNGKKTFEELTIPENNNIEVKFDNVSFSYPSHSTEIHNKKVLDGLSFSVRTGETVALVSGSGGGKTTAARLLQRFWDVDDGKITINDTDIRAFTLEALRNIITVVPQDVYLFNESIRNNIKMAGINASEEEILSASKNAQADSIINKLPNGYETIVGERGFRLSGGEKQRLSIAQAFLKNSPVLVLDEASANLDSENERLINTAVEGLKKGRATIVIAHRISTIRSADRIAVIENGRISGIGTYDELINTNDYFRKLIGAEYEN